MQNSLVTPKLAQAVSKSALAKEPALLTSSCSKGQGNPATAPALLHLGGREMGAFSLRLDMLTQICKSLRVTSPMAPLTIIYRAKEEKDSTCLSFVKCNCFVHLGEKVKQHSHTYSPHLSRISVTELHYTKARRILELVLRC